MTEQKNNKKSSMGIGCVLIRIAAVLFCLVVVSTYLMSGLFARYVSTGNGGDSARVAGFDVVVTGDLGALNITSLKENNDTYKIVVNNQSEVAVSYDMSVVYANKTVDAAGINPQFDANSGTISPDGTAEHTLTFTVDWSEFTKNATEEKKELEIPFSVVINVTQID